MKRIANKNAKQCVSDLEEFKGSNLSAEWKGNKYVVYSYNWYPIYVFVEDKWYENTNKYSRSTARQMSNARPDCGTMFLDTEALNQLIRG